MMLATTALLVGALTVAAPPSQGPAPRAPQTDQTVQVASGARLDVRNFAGEVVVRAWDKDAVRVQARHTPRTIVSIATPASGVVVTASEAGGSVDYEISAPAWMPIRVEGTYNYIAIDGSQADVSAENVRGDILIRNTTGTVTARTIEGLIIVEGGRGKMNLGAVNEGIRITGTAGEIVADTTNGDVTLTAIESPRVEVSTVNGDVTYDGPLLDRGTYRFASHNGDITMTLAETVSATFTVRSYEGGDFRSALPLKGPPKEDVRQGRRNSYTIGTGGAQVEIETFGGDIRLRRREATDAAREPTSPRR
jgi:hypothetical protein